MPSAKLMAEFADQVESFSLKGGLLEGGAPALARAEILAFQLIWQALSIALTVVRGLPFLPSVLRDIARDPG